MYMQSDRPVIDAITNVIDLCALMPWILASLMLRLTSVDRYLLQSDMRTYLSGSCGFRGVQQFTFLVKWLLTVGENVGGLPIYARMTDKQHQPNTFGLKTDFINTVSEWIMKFTMVRIAHLKFTVWCL